jgi:hypothetical protein
LLAGIPEVGLTISPSSVKDFIVDFRINFILKLLRLWQIPEVGLCKGMSASALYGRIHCRQRLRPD